MIGCNVLAATYQGQELCVAGTLGQRLTESSHQSPEDHRVLLLTTRGRSKA